LPRHVVVFRNVTSPVLVGESPDQLAVRHWSNPGCLAVLVGLVSVPVPLDYKQVVLKELIVIGANGHVYDEDAMGALDLIASGRVDPGPLVSHRL
jgi:threonine dehydrogenase-like Zn-dependent dehydrogenase